MARILFISDNFINESLGITCLSSYLKTNGHDVQLSLISEYKRIEGLLTFIKNTDPDIIGFSVMTAQVKTFRSITKIIKEKTHRRIIWGGPHCTFMPENVLENEYVDIICIGEGEEALLTLMNRLDGGKDYSDIANLWLRKGDKYIKNEIGYLETNLDKYPFPDRELYYTKYPFLSKFNPKRFITQRGCPYECSYCFEPLLKDLYRDKGKFVRHHSVEYIIGEINETIHKYPTKTIHFSDDTFNLDKNWVKVFLLKYNKDINLPFTCNISVSDIDDELIKRFKESRCGGVVFGLECGVESVRVKLLNKKITDRKYIEATKLLRKHKLKFITNLMVCLPNETLNGAIKSLHFNKLLKPYNARIGVIRIYKGTKLANFLVENNLCDEVGEFVYKAKDVSNEHEYIKNLIWAGYLFVKFPLLIHFAQMILMSQVSRLFRPLKLLTYWQDARFFKISLLKSLRYFWYSRKIFVEGIGKEEAADFKKIET